MSDDNGEKTEKPTQRKRDQAQKEGQVPLSQEVGVAIAVIALVIAIAIVLPWVMKLHLEATASMLSPNVQGPLQLEDALRAINTLAYRAAVIASPIALTAMTMGTLASVAQIGWSINWENAGIKWSRLDPQNWLKKVFSVELPVNLAKSIFKGLGVVAVAAIGVVDLPERLWRLAGIPAAVAAVSLQEVAKAVTYRVAAALVVLAFLDILWTRYRHEQKLMMSRQEIKDELKDSEGNPHVKGAQRRLMREMGSQKLKDAVGEATVVTTNPTHYAVALRYWRGKDATPVVVAKGTDYKAQRIKAFAREMGVPVIEDKPLARALHAVVSEGQAVPVDLYKSVARLLAIVYRRRGYLSRGQST